MKTLYYWSALSCLFCINEAHADFLSHSTNLGTQIKTNPTKESEPALNFVKTASVNFIAGDSRNPIKFMSWEAMRCLKEGYNVQSCPGLLPGDICPYEPNYMNGCCAPDYKYSDGDACVYPLSQDEKACGGKYRCYCDRSKFPYDISYVCDEPKIFSTESCTYNDEIFFADCVCPIQYSELCLASQHLLSKGEGCSYQGKEYYTSCSCENGYNLSCDVVGPQNPSDYCLWNGVKYYKNCKTYAENEEINFNYTGDVQSVSLPAGKYKFQVWGAQGGGSSGSKGGYSEGVISFDTSTTFYLFVGGQGGSTQGGWNGGGGSTGYSSYSSGGTNGYSYPYAGGGGSDVALVNSSVTYSGTRTTRDASSLLSRIIVAGGGAGYSSWSKRVTTTVNNSRTVASCSGTTTHYHPDDGYNAGDCVFSTVAGRTYSLNNTGSTRAVLCYVHDCSTGFTATESLNYHVFFYKGTSTDTPYSASVIESYSTSSTSSNSGSGGNGQQGGGTSGAGQYPGTQTAAGSGSYAGAFGLGATQSVTNYRYASGAGGGGWYGGGASYSDSSTSYVNYSGGGSGFVYTAGVTVPSGYSVPATYQLTNATTKAGNVSFPSTSGGTETGHAGNGYIKITVLEQYESSEVAQECDLTKYVLEGVDVAAGTYMVCNDASGSHYYYTACNDGWVLRGNKCEMNSCDGYVALTENIEHCEIVSSCPSGSKIFYTCTQCEADHLYDTMSGQCLCVDAPFSEKPDEVYGAVKTCVDTEGTKYGYTECYEKFSLNRGDCIEDADE